MAPPDVVRSVNPISTRGADYAHHITASPPGFENPAACQTEVIGNILSPKVNLTFENRLKYFSL